MRATLQPGYVLHRRPYQETSSLLELFTPEFGRVAVLAKGAKRPKSQWSGALEPFQLLQLSWSGRGELKTLTGAELAEAPVALPGNLAISGLYLNELLVRLCQREDPHPDLFAIYRRTIAGLSQVVQSGEASDQQVAEEILLRIFEKRLLGELGYGMQLVRDGRSGAPIHPDWLYRWTPDAGPIPAIGEALPPSETLLRGATLLSLEREDLRDAQVRREAKRLLRAAIDQHLDGKPLHSRSLRRAMSQ